MEKIYSVEEIQTIEKEEFKKLRNSYVLMKRAGTNCAKKIYISKLKYWQLLETIKHLLPDYHLHFSQYFLIEFL